MFVSITSNNRFWSKEPDKYNPPYYRFSTKNKIHLHLGEQFNYYLKNQKNFIKSVSAYYEINSCDFKIISAITNKSLRIQDYYKLALGIKVNFD